MDRHKFSGARGPSLRRLSESEKSAFLGSESRAASLWGSDRAAFRYADSVGWGIIYSLARKRYVVLRVGIKGL